MNEPVCIELLGGLRIRRGDRVVSRFRTQKTAALLAYLACFLDRSQAREEVVELLWPDDDPEDGKRSLRVALSSLRKQLEPPPTSFNSVLVTDRQSIRLNRQVVSTDAAGFECAVRAAEETSEPAARAIALRRAVDLYRGPFLPGSYDDWAVRERDRLEQVYATALGRLPGALAAAGELGSAIDYAHRRVGIDALSEEAHCELIRLLIEDHQLDAARSRYADMVRLFRAELDAAPSAAAQALMSALPDTQKASRGARSPAAVTAPVSPPARPPANEDGWTRRDTPRLPLYLTPFVGREDEMAKLRAQLVRGATAPVSRLLTLTGPGGSGKTRLAIEAARSLAGAFDGRIWFVPLADADAADLIPDAALRAIDLPRDPGLRPIDQVVHALAQNAALLLLDNFEQVAEDGAGVVWTLLDRCPLLACLVTSRQRLDLPGEREIPVAPLTVPTAPGVPERLMEFPSVSLFVDRAQMARPDFQITRDNASSIVAICARLDGLPLAIELAASWSGVLTPAQMLSRLEERLSLESRRKGGPARQRSLRETIDWSYRLLTPGLQRIFATLSVFRGGWTLEAAGVVCDEPAVLDRLQELRERSLVVAEESDSQMRFRLLETLREFGWERLAEGGQTEVAREGHLAYYLALAEGEAGRIGGGEQAEGLRRLETEHDNLREALRASVELGAAGAFAPREMGFRLAVALTPFWDVRGYQAEGRRWLQTLLSGSGEVADIWRARAVCAAGALAWQQADYAEARKLLEESLAIWRELGERAGLAASLNTLANVLADQSEYAAARAVYEESLSLRRESEDRRGIASSLNNLGIVSLELGDYAGARTLLEESLTIRRELADMRGTATCLNNLGDVSWRGGEMAAARSLYEEALAIRRQLGDRRGIASSLSHLANLLAGNDDVDAAESLYVESLGILRDLGDRRGITGCLEEIAGLAAAQGRVTPAVRLLGAAERLREMMDAPLPPIELPAHSRKIASLRAALPRDQLDALWQEGRDMPLDAAIALALTNRRDVC